MNADADWAPKAGVLLPPKSEGEVSPKAGVDAPKAGVDAPPKLKAISAHFTTSEFTLASAIHQILKFTFRM